MYVCTFLWIKKSKFGREDHMSIATSPNSEFLLINTKFWKDGNVQLAWNELYKLVSISAPKLLKTSKAAGPGQGTVVPADAVTCGRGQGLGCHSELGGEPGIRRKPFNLYLKPTPILCLHELSHLKKERL